MTARIRRISALGPIAIGFGLALLCAQAAAASSVSPLPRSDYTVRAACAAPAPNRAACLALQLVPRTAEARAHTHPLGITRAAAAPSAAPSPAAGDFGLRPQDLHSAYQLPTTTSSAQTIALVDAYNDLSAEEDLAGYAKEFGLPECTEANGCFKKVNQNGEAANLPFPQSQASLTKEETLCEEGEGRKSPTTEEEEACYLVYEAQGWGRGDLARHRDRPRDLPELPHRTRRGRLAVLRRSRNRRGSGRADRRQRDLQLLGRPGMQRDLCIEDSPAFNHPGIVITAAAGDDGYLNWLEEPTIALRRLPRLLATCGRSRRDPPEDLGPEGEWTGETVWNDGGEREGVKEGYGAGGEDAARSSPPSPGSRASRTGPRSAAATNARSSMSPADADPYTGVAVHDTSPECEYRYEEAERYTCSTGARTAARASPLR